MSTRGLQLVASSHFPAAGSRCEPWWSELPNLGSFFPLTPDLNVGVGHGPAALWVPENRPLQGGPRTSGQGWKRRRGVGDQDDSSAGGDRRRGRSPPRALVASPHQGGV